MENFSSVYMKFQLPQGAFPFHADEEKLCCIKAFLDFKIKYLEITSYVKRYHSYYDAFKIK